MPMQATEFIWFDGKLVPWWDAKIHVMSHVLHYGSSVFEGIRAYETTKGPAVFCLDPHVERLFNGCKVARMPVPYTPAEIRAAILETIRVNKLKSCYIRPLVFRGYDSIGVEPRKCPVQVIIGTIEWGRYLGPEAIEQGVDVMVSSWRRPAPDTLTPMAKIGGQYVNSQYIIMEAHDLGYTEGIALDVYGYVSEGSGENIFVVHKGVIYTPPIGAAALRGITRDCVSTIAADLGYQVREQNLLREFLYMADEVFFTGTAAEVTPIRSIDRIPVGEGRRGPVTKAIQDQFFGITSGEIEDRYGWLTMINDQ
ncbi:MAG: branched chain amino acid aminotransferase [Chloroflexi bacterium RBG_16_57_9]|nr:MAG: branched chain amino acid aminotransferase [Chloroflexi bacterium RBG_16_57_9]